MIAPTDPPDARLVAARAVLRDVFGHDGFREGQEEVVDAVLEGRDVLCVMPTGAGKASATSSPALVRGGLTLVVSPLIALMDDQVSSLKGRGVAAAAIHSAVDAASQEAALAAAARASSALALRGARALPQLALPGGAGLHGPRPRRRRRGPLHQPVGPRLPSGLPAAR
ncbi:MAG: DEAD/DEAH box helicase [Planctomycetota bacterium]